MTGAPVDRDEFISFVRTRGLAVVSSIGPDGAPQSALVGVAATEKAEIVFDTVDASRKYRNIRSDGRVSLVMGWDDEVTVQCEGVADVLGGPDLERCQQFYFEQYPDGRQRKTWSGIVYIRVVPRWLRYCDFRPQSFGSSETTW
jgi:pyridoxine/pyridoxamine 5'-phosphate oxidase